MIESLIGPITGLLDKFVEDKDQKNQWLIELLLLPRDTLKKLQKGR